LFRYFSQERYANAFLDGELLFRALSYFRDFEDRDARGDPNEGQSKYRPPTGLIVINLTQNTTVVLSGFSFAANVRQDEIFIYCLSMAHADRFYNEFDAVVCVEITDIGAFCRRVQRALLSGATFPAMDSGRPRLGHKVEYYDETEAGNPRWALPDRIAISKLRGYAWQAEYRMAFSGRCIQIPGCRDALDPRRSPRRAKRGPMSAAIGDRGKPAGYRSAAPPLIGLLGFGTTFFDRDFRENAP
jgi:hypothetical protein